MGTIFVDPSSSRGPAPCDSAVYPELVAPGVAVRTADLSFGGVVPDPFTTVTGSSFAAPHVAGALALLKSAFPAADLPRLETALKISARDLGAVGPDHEYGYGSLDVMEAYLYLLSNSGKDTAPPVNDLGFSVAKPDQRCDLPSRLGPWPMIPSPAGPISWRQNGGRDQRLPLPAPHHL